MRNSFAIIALLAAASATGAIAQSAPAPRADLARMNLAPTKGVVRPVYSRQEFTTTDDIPTKVDYKLPAQGMAASIGMNDGGERGLENDEINQAAAIGFSRPDDTVGASIDFRF